MAPSNCLESGQNPQLSDLIADLTQVSLHNRLKVQNLSQEQCTLEIQKTLLQINAPKSTADSQEAIGMLILLQSHELRLQINQLRTEVHDVIADREKVAREANEIRNELKHTQESFSNRMSILEAAIIGSKNVVEQQPLLPSRENPETIQVTHLDHSTQASEKATQEKSPVYEVDRNEIVPIVTPQPVAARGRPRTRDCHSSSETDCSDGSHTRNAETTRVARLRVLDILAQDVEKFDPYGTNRHVSDYFREIERCFQDIPDATSYEKVKLIWKTSGPRVRKDLDSLSPDIADSYPKLRAWMIGEYERPRDYPSAVLNALRVRHQRSEPPRAYFSRLHTAYFEGRATPGLEEDAHFQSLFLHNLHGSIRTEVKVACRRKRHTMLEMRRLAHMVWEAVTPADRSQPCALNPCHQPTAQPRLTSFEAAHKGGPDRDGPMQHSTNPQQNEWHHQQNIIARGGQLPHQHYSHITHNTRRRKRNRRRNRQPVHNQDQWTNHGSHESDSRSAQSWRDTSEHDSSDGSDQSSSELDSHTPRHRRQRRQSWVQHDSSLSHSATD